MGTRTLALALLLAPCTSSIRAHAQSDGGNVLGIVADSSRAAAPPVAVTLTSLETGVTRQLFTNGSGSYAFESVPVGTYRVDVDAPGFKPVSTPSIDVSVGSRVRVDLTLVLASASEQVTVSAAPGLLETETSDHSLVVNAGEIVNLPLNGRDPADLALLTPGVNKSSLENETATSREGSYNVNGQRSQVNNYLLDGLDNNSWSLNDLGFSYQEIQLSPDALAQFRFTTDNQSAEFGRSAGGLVQFGAAVGLPILHDRFFFFGDYEGLRRSSHSPLSATLPTTAQASGVFKDANGTAIPITNPYTGAVYANGIVPIAALQASGQISALGVNTLAALPTAGLLTQAPGAGNNFVSFPLGTIQSDKGDARGDYFFSPKMSLFLRYSHRVLTALDPAPIPGPIYSTSKGNLNAYNHQVAAGYVWQLSAASTLDVRAGVSFNGSVQAPIALGQTNLLTAAGIPNAPSDPSFSGGLNTTVVTGFTQFGRTNSTPTYVDPFVIDPKVNYALLRGRHSLKFGYEYIRLTSLVSNFKPVYGADTYKGQFSKGKAVSIATDPSYAEAFNTADFLFGARSKYELSALHKVQYNQRMHFLYAQDDWRASDTLTLNLGLRYELGTPPYETNNQLSNFDPALSPTSGLTLAAPGSIASRALVQRNNLNFAPRVGLSYSVDPKTVLRASYGITYQQFLRAATVNELAQNAPYNIDVVVNQFPAQSKTSPQPLCTALTQAPLSCFRPTQQGYSTGLLSVANASPLLSVTNYVPLHTPTPYIESYLLSVQRQLFKDTFLDLAYVGNHGVHLQILTDYNQAVPNVAGGTLSLQARRPITTFAGIQESFNGGPSLYNSLQAKLEKHFGQGLYLVDSFTFSHSQDVAAANQELVNGDSAVVDRNDVQGTFTRSSFDVPLNDTLAVVYTLPFGRKQRFLNSNAALDYAIGGWQATAINTFQSGLPINITYAESTAQDVSDLITYRPNLTGAPVFAAAARARIAGQPGQYSYLNPASISNPTAANTPFGNAPRNVARAPGYADLDLGLHKRFPLGNGKFGEGTGLEFRAEAFNLLNRSNAQAPDSISTDAAYGVISSYFPARELQLALRLVF